MAEMFKELIVNNELVDQRIDKLISVIGDMSRNHVQKLIEEGKVSVNDKICPSNKYKCSAGDVIKITCEEPAEVDVLPENIPVDIVYEDEDVIIVNKARGMVVHPAPGHSSGTLVNALLYHCGDKLSGINGEKRPGIVHRIDKDTSGLLVICKNDNAHNKLSELLGEHNIDRVYYCIVNGHFKEKEGTIDKAIGRHPIDRKKMSVRSKTPKRAVTHYKVIFEFTKNYSLIECRLETGRTHQIRVHMSSIGHPLLGDIVYGSEKQPFGLDGQILHAAILGFAHPKDGRLVRFTSSLPEYFTRAAYKLVNGNEERKLLEETILNINNERN